MPILLNLLSLTAHFASKLLIAFLSLFCKSFSLLLISSPYCSRPNEVAYYSPLSWTKINVGLSSKQQVYRLTVSGYTDQQYQGMQTNGISVYRLTVSEYAD